MWAASAPHCGGPHPSDDRNQFSSFNSEYSGLAHYGTPGDTTSSVGFRKTDNAW